MGGAGFEPAKAMPPDLQSGPFNHLGIHPVTDDPSRCRLSAPWFNAARRTKPRAGRTRAGGESRTHNRRFTKPVLCRLSYASHREAMKITNIPGDLAIASDFSINYRISTARAARPDESDRGDGQGAGRTRSTEERATKAEVNLAERARLMQGGTAE